LHDHRKKYQVKKWPTRMVGVLFLKRVWPNTHHHKFTNKSMAKCLGCT
jgi:hypothetical protein